MSFDADGKYAVVVQPSKIARRGRQAGSRRASKVAYRAIRKISRIHPVNVQDAHEIFQELASTGDASEGESDTTPRGEPVMRARCIFLSSMCWPEPLQNDIGVEEPARYATMFILL